MRVVNGTDGKGKIRQMTRGEIQSAHDALDQLSALKLPFGMLLKLLPISRALHAIAEDSGKAYNAIVDAHAERDDKGLPVLGDTPGSVKVRDVAAFNKDVETMNAQTVKLSSPVSPLTMKELQTAIGETKIELRTLANLGPLLAE